MLFNVLFIIYIRGARSAGKTDPNKREKRPFHQPQTHQRFLIYFLFFSASDFALGFFILFCGTVPAAGLSFLCKFKVPQAQNVFIVFSGIIHAKLTFVRLQRGGNRFICLGFVFISSRRNFFDAASILMRSNWLLRKCRTPTF